MAVKFVLLVCERSEVLLHLDVSTGLLEDPYNMTDLLQSKQPKRVQGFKSGSFVSPSSSFSSSKNSSTEPL